MHRKTLASQDKFSVAEPEGRASGCERAEDSANLCIQRLNAASNNAVDLAFGWDPTEPVATRPLWMQRVSGTYNFFYFHDGNKNVSDLVSYQSARGVPAHYEYAPFGAVIASTTNTAFTAFNVAEINPFKFSSEFHDSVIGLSYYNYRHYNPDDGRWSRRDPVRAFDARNVYSFVGNHVTILVDLLGLKWRDCCPGEFGNVSLVYDIFGEGDEKIDSRLKHAFELLKATKTFATVSTGANLGASAGLLLYETLAQAAPSILLAGSDAAIDYGVSKGTQPTGEEAAFRDLLTLQKKANKMLYPKMQGWVIYQKCKKGLLGSSSWKNMKLGPSKSYAIYTDSSLWKNDEWISQTEAEQLIYDELMNLLASKETL